ncbi:MAG TPA: DUF4124 domain-containing protein, partial [Polyangiaceae bacterium]|nr:DUF4124 domain-containing protein [Polyangiaceae bacterium]
MRLPRASGRHLSKSKSALGILAGVCIWTLAGAGQADIYKSVDANGVISFTNNPRAGSKLVAREKPRVRAFMPSDNSPERYTRYDEHIREAATL